MKYTRKSLTDEINSYPDPEVLGRINKKVLLEILKERRRKHNTYSLGTLGTLMLLFLIFGSGMIIGNILTTVLA